MEYKDTYYGKHSYAKLRAYFLTRKHHLPESFNLRHCKSERLKTNLLNYIDLLDVAVVTKSQVMVKRNAQCRAWKGHLIWWMEYFEEKEYFKEFGF